MKRLIISVAILLVFLTGCAPGSTIEVGGPGADTMLTTPGPNPARDQSAENGRVARLGDGLWHGIIAPVTAVGSLFNPHMEIYEVHNNGREYNVGFLIGVALVFTMLGLIGGRRR